MNVPEPAGDRIDRGALERIIQRAAELQAAEREIGEGLTEPELLKLGREVGIPDRYLQQALLEERTRSVVAPERGPLTWLIGPRLVGAERTIPDDAARIARELQEWMADGELLSVKRRYPNQTSWEAQQGAFAALRRSLGFGGRRYVLARAREVIGQVQRVQDRIAHVALIADLSNSRGGYIGGALFLAGLGVAAAAIVLVAGVALPAAALPSALGLMAGWFAARRRLKQVERFQVALEQVLDRLEHEERKPPQAGEESSFIRFASEIRKSIKP